MTLGDAFDLVFHPEVTRIGNTEIDHYQQPEAEPSVSADEHNQTLNEQ